MKDDDDTQADGHDESAQRMPDPPGDKHRQNESSANRPPLMVIMLMRDELRSAQVLHIVVVGAVPPKQDPADMRVPKALVDAVGIMLRVGKKMVLTVLRCPFQSRFFERCRAKEKKEETQDGRSFIGTVGKEPMIANRNRHACYERIQQKQPKFGSRDAAVVGVKRRPDNRDNMQKNKEDKPEPSDLALWQWVIVCDFSFFHLHKNPGSLRHGIDRRDTSRPTESDNAHGSATRDVAARPVAASRLDACNMNSLGWGAETENSETSQNANGRVFICDRLLPG